MAMFVLRMQHESDYLIEGITYYKFSVWVLTSDFLPAFGTGKALAAVESVLPEPGAVDYVPRSISLGETFGAWTSPGDLYLLGVEMFGGFGSDLLEKYLVAYMHATYTVYAPDEEGVTFLPDWVAPTPSTHFSYPGYDGIVHLPLSASLASDVIAYQHNVSNFNEFVSTCLWVFHGATVADWHFLNHLDEFSFFNLSPLGPKFQLFPSPPYGISPFGLTDWIPPAGVGLTYESVGDVWTWELATYQSSAPGFILPGENGWSPRALAPAVVPVGVAAGLLAPGGVAGAAIRTGLCAPGQGGLQYLETETGERLEDEYGDGLEAIL
jgi:hypothetical protein